MEKLNLSYNDICCISDCIKKALECAMCGESVLTIPFDNIEQEIEVLKAYNDEFDQYIDEADWE